MGCWISKGNELFRSVMNSSSNLPPTGLLFRLRVIGHERKGEGPFLDDSFFFRPPRRGAEVGGGGWQPQVDLSCQLERTDRQSSKQRSFLGPACRGSQRPTVKQALFQREPLPWEGSKEASELPWIPVYHPVEQATGACKTISASSFPDCRPWGFLESVGWKLANRMRNAMPHLATEICFQPCLWTPTPCLSLV